MAHIVWLADAPADPVHLGGKGAGLARLTSAGLPVPDGFVVTTTAFEAVVDADARRALHELATSGTQASIAALEEVSRHLRSEVLDRSDGHAVLDAVTDAYRQLGQDAPVAVRSSASGEDAADHSFAGEHDSYLWVRGADAVARAVRDCWASLYTARAVEYRQHEGGLPEGAMAVVVQRMVDARSAGVFMTLNPSNGDRSKVVIESVWGLGEPLVRGQVNPDRFVVDKVTGQILQRDITVKATRAVRAPDGGIATVDVDDGRREAPSLTDDEIAVLVGCGRRIERAEGVPQDGEFALTDEPAPDNLRVLQTRPETAWSRARRPSVTGGRTAMQQILHTIATPDAALRGPDDAA
ncbi:MAG: PEP/pyruvate-binding domain-containing protein [Actinobacteria bacterium]|nr:PEP/pyruvate-binding domain-containing protein [Actinomycetota bacterium]